MASFYAELQVEGRTYPVRHCSSSFHQHTSERGRVHAKVRHEPLRLLLDVPDDDTLLVWASTAHKPLAGQVVFYNATQRTALETLSFAAGECVEYTEIFQSGDGGEGAYRCQLVITAPAFELRAGGPAAAALPAAAASVVQKLTASPVVSAVANMASSVVPLASGAGALAGTASALKAGPEYSLAEFAATIGGAEHMQPQSVITQLYDLYNTASAASVPGKPSLPDWKALEDLLRNSYYDDPTDGLKKKLNGHWPPANGGYQRQVVQLKKGDVFDRYQGSVIDKKPDPTDPTKKADLEPGDEFDVTFIGEFLSPVALAGEPPVVQSFESRALDRPKDAYPLAYTIEILEDVPLDAVQGELAQVIPWYNQPGGGTQMRLDFPKPDWKRQEWSKMQSSGYAKITLDSSPSGKYAVLPDNRAKKIA
jgi:hypothetical protein